jgi:hypothetical protein
MIKGIYGFHIFFLYLLSFIDPGLSSNLDKWAFRPEIGYDGCFSFGLGLDYHLNTK